MVDVLLEGYRHKDPASASYNEFVLDAAYFEGSLPYAVEAFFYPETAACVSDPRCQSDAVRAHSRFLMQYRLSAEEVPLLAMRINGDGWDAPFIPVPSSQRG